MFPRLSREKVLYNFLIISININFDFKLFVIPSVRSRGIPLVWCKGFLHCGRNDNQLFLEGESNQRKAKKYY